MGCCKICTYSGYKKITYTCDYVKDNIDEMKKDFKEVNASDYFIKSHGKDEKYDEYCHQLDDFLHKCKCEYITLKCKRCSEDDHEGYFCRCEMRNINLAKQLRNNAPSGYTFETIKI